MQTQQISLIPCLGIKTANTENQTEAGTYCHDAENIHIDQYGKISTRPQWQKVCEQPCKYLYFSNKFNTLLCVSDKKLAGASIAENPLLQHAAKNNEKTLNYQGVNANTCMQVSLQLSPILDIPISSKPYYCDLPLEILIATNAGLYAYNGDICRAYTRNNPYKPFVLKSNNSCSLKKGRYHIGISYVYDKGRETGLSPISEIDIQDGEAIEINIPAIYDDIEQIRLYMSEANGDTLWKVEDYPSDTTQITITNNPTLGRACEVMYKDPMPTGKHLQYAHGRLYVSQRNKILYSETLQYHLTDLRYNYIELPERVTFIIAVNGGLWVGQRTGVIYLAGTNPQEWVVRKTSTTAPIPESAILCKQGEVSSELTQSGDVAVWLGEDGYHIGTASGEHIAPQDGVIANLHGTEASTAIIKRRIYSNIQA